MWELCQHCEPLFRSVAEACLSFVGLVPGEVSVTPALAALAGIAAVVGSFKIVSEQPN